MITLKIDPIEFETVSGAKAIVTGLAPQKNVFILVGTVEAANKQVEMCWWASGETLDNDDKAHNLVEQNELGEIAYLAGQICPG